MIFHPSILALYVASLLICFIVLYSAFYGLQILRRWDIRSGSEGQLVLERKTYLISTLLSYLFSLEIISLFSLFSRSTNCILSLSGPCVRQAPFT